MLITLLIVLALGALICLPLTSMGRKRAGRLIGRLTASSPPSLLVAL